MRFELVTGSAEKWLDFIRSNFMDLFKKLLKVNLYAWGTILLGLIIAVVITVAGTFTGPMVIGFVLLAVIVGLVIFFFSSAITMAAYKIVDEQHKSKMPVDILGVAKQKFFPVVGYTLVVLFIFVVAAVPFGILAYLMGGFSSMRPEMIRPLLTFLQLSLGLVALFLGFFFQFGLLELIISDRGVFESMRRSISLVKNNFLETIIFSVLRVAIGWIISIPLMIALYGILFVGVLLIGGGGIAAAAINPMASIAVLGVGILIGVVVFIVLMMVYSTINQTILMPLTYRYWKTISEYR